MSHRDKFPPNRFLKKYMTPWRTIGFIFGLIAFELIFGKYYPRQLANGAMCCLAVILPVGVGLMIWQIVWDIRNPAPPREQCPTCHQLMPEKDDE